MPHVLILGDRSDPHTDRVIRHIESRGDRSTVVDVWAPFGTMSVHTAADEFTSAWLRLKPRARDSISEQEAFALRERKEFLYGLIAHAVPSSARLNDPWCQESARNKPRQLDVARQCGWATPDCVIGTDLAQIRGLFDGNAEVIYKPLSWLATSDGSTLFTNVVSQSFIEENWQLIGNVPGMFQRRVPKAFEYRTTVIDKVIFNVRIHSQDREDTRLDWRRNQADVRYEVCSLGPDYDAKIMAVMDALSLNYGAFDIIERPDGQFVFLEVNPAGNWLWLEDALDLSISGAIADFLLKTS